MASLEIHARGTRKVYQILDREVVLGASTDADLPLPDLGLAPLHAAFVETAGGRYRIAARGGSVVLGKEQVDNRVLEHGDLIRVGDAVVVYLVDGEPRPVIPRRLLGPAAEPAAESEREVTADERAAASPADEPAQEPEAASTDSPAGAADRGDAAPPTRQQPPPEQPPQPEPPSPAPQKSPGIVIEPIEAPTKRAVRAPVRTGSVGAGKPTRPPAVTSSGVGPTAPVPRRQREDGGGRAALRRPSRGSPPWAVLSMAVLGGIAVVVILLRVVTATGAPEPRDLLNLAETKLESGEIVMARSYVDQAERLGPSAAVQREIARLRRRIDEVAEAKAELLALGNARSHFDVRLRRFHEFYLVGKENPRSAAREFVDLLEEWLSEFRVTCTETEEGRGLIAQAERWFTTYRPIAQLDEPDTAEDVIFSAARRTRRRDRNNYREAIGLLDRWLATGAQREDAARVREQRAQWVEDAREWYDDFMRRIDRLAKDGSVDEAIRRLEFVVEESSLPEWHEDAAARLAELRAR